MASLCLAVFLISAAAVALELLLMRTLSIGSWHHFSYMVISVALLGFGASGVLLTVFQRVIRPRWRGVLWLLSVAFALSVPAAHLLAARVPLNVLELLWDPRQSGYLLLTYLALFLPFLFAGGAVGLVLTVQARRANLLYFFNLLGSGVGAVAAVLAMYGRPPVSLLLVVAILAAGASLVLALRQSRLRAVVSVAVMACLVLTFGYFRPLQQAVSQFKAFSYYSSLPDAKVEGRSYSPLGRLDIISASSIHLSPGLSLDFRGTLPPQQVLLTDGDSAVAVSREPHLERAEYLDYATSALVYHLLDRPQVCIVGAGAGGDLAQALHGGASHVTAVELNPQVVDLVRQAAPEVAALFDRPQVTLRVAEARFFLESTPQKFDLLQISLLDSFTAASAGLYSLSESHLYTVEAIQAALARLRPGGVLSITRWLRTPPRDNPKMVATVVEAMRRGGLDSPRERIIMIRGMLTATILVSPDPFTDRQRREVRRFAASRSFDLVYLSDLRPEEINRYHRLDDPLYWLLAREVIEGDRDQVFADYAYRIAPATDDRPFFFDFFRWDSLPRLLRAFGRQWRPFAEWGYLVLVASLVQILAVSLVLIMLPAWLLKRRSALAGHRKVALYFALLGLAFIFLEMGFITKLTLLLGNPIHATAVVLAAFLVFSGLGSLSGGRWFGPPEKAVPRAVVGIVLSAAVALALLSFGFSHLVRLPFAVRVLAALAITGSMAFFMGLPFPSGLRMLDRSARPLLPWAWAVNGFASVVGAVGGTCLAMSIGFRALVALAIGLYILAALVAPRLAR